ncbi:hypothetical protein IL306_004928 [Fusarium sp. DS 682]|nr:hypothetical protein IL306_004928 [Fusarium sp. DS 682]
MPVLTEVKNIYRGLVMVEKKCTAIEKGQSSSNPRSSDLNSEQWDALKAIHRTLLHEHHDSSAASSPLSPQLYELRKIALNHSLHSRTLRRFSDRLLPLLRREQELESARLWLEVLKLSSSLIGILNKGGALSKLEEMALLDTMEYIEAILERLKSWFRNKYEDLSRKKDATEEQSITAPIFEFPNNIRHVCTTMPWTILPALIVLWGVCWMFIIGPGELEPEELNPPVPTFSPVPAGYGFYDGPAANYEGETLRLFPMDISDD